MPRIWRYVLAADNGMAPCPQAGMLSLTCCKPMIRRGANPGDWVVSFLPKGQGRGLVAWAGRVASTMPLGDYQAQHPSRHDALYRRVGLHNGREMLEPLRDDYHPDHRSRSTDMSGRNALIFDPYWYWGREVVSAPEWLADLAHYHVGQSTKGSSAQRLADLEAWLRSVSMPGIHGEPRDARRTKPGKGSITRRRSC